MTVISLLNTLDFLQQQFPILHQLMDLAVKSVFIVIIALTMRFLFRTRSASTLSVFWLAAIISLLLLPLFKKIVPEIPILFAVNQELLHSNVSEALPILIKGQHSILVLAHQSDLLRIVEFIYLGIMALMMGYLACGIARMLVISQLAKPHNDPRAIRILDTLKSVNGVECQIQLLTSPRVCSPVTWGIWRHRIIFPATTLEWNEELLTHVIGHELGHIQRKDWVSFILARLTTCLYWPNPLVWLAQKNMVLEAEKSCDDIAADTTRGQFSYAENLVTVASAICHSRQTLTPAMFGNGSQLESRVKHALKTNQARANYDFTDIFPIILLIAVITAPISALSMDFRLVKKTQAQQPELIPLHYFEKEQPATQRIDDGGLIVYASKETSPEAPPVITTVSRSINPPTENFGPYTFTTASYSLIAPPFQEFADTLPLLISNPQPHYPDPARSRGIEGHVVAEYSISSSGKAINISIIESAPARTFERSVIRAISQYSYHPILIDNRVSTANTVRRKFVFSLAQEI